MQLTRRAEYAVRTAVDLADQPPESMVLSREIAERQAIPPTFMVHVVGDLVRAGIVRAARGAGGGLTLAAPAEEINLRRVVEAAEGPIALNKCLLGRDACDRRGCCPVGDVWERAQASMLAVLEEASLADLASGSVKIAERIS